MDTNLLDTALTLSREGKSKEARELYRTLRVTSPENIDELSKLGLIATHLGDIEFALNLSENRRGLVSVNPYSYCNLGDLYNCLGKFDEAVEAFTKAMRMNQELIPHGLAHAYEALGYFVKAGHILNALSHINSKSSPNQDTPKSKAVLICALPKSAGSSICDALRKYGGYENSETIATMNIHRMPYSRLCHHAYLNSLQYKAVLHTHLIASRRNINIIQNSSLNKILVHFRDPRQAIVSYFYHCQSGLGLGRCLAENNQYMALDSREQMQWLIERYFPFFVNWISEWISFEEHSAEFSLKLKITTFEQMTETEPHTFLEEICKFLDIPLTDNMSIEKKRYRKGRTDEWRTLLDESLRKWMWKGIPENLKERFGWTR